MGTKVSKGKENQQPILIVSPSLSVSSTSQNIGKDKIVQGKYTKD